MIPTRPSKVKKLRDELEAANGKFLDQEARHEAEEDRAKKWEEEHKRAIERVQDEQMLVDKMRKEAAILQQERTMMIDSIEDEWTLTCESYQQEARSAIEQTERLQSELASERVQAQANRDDVLIRALSETQGLNHGVERLKRELEDAAASRQNLSMRHACEEEAAKAASSTADVFREQAASLRIEHACALQELKAARMELHDSTSRLNARLRAEGEELALARAEAAEVKYEFRLELAQSRDPDSELASKSKIKQLRHELEEAKWTRDKALDDRRRAVEERDYARKSVSAVEANQCRDIAELHARIAKQQQQLQDAERECREVLDRSRRLQVCGADVVPARDRLDRRALNAALEPVRGYLMPR